MIGKAGMTMGALLPVAAAAVASDRGAAIAVTAPDVWSVLGYQFEAGSMIAALCACAAVRYYVSQQPGVHRLALDLPISTLVLMFTAAAVTKQRPEPLYALAIGTGFGILGAGIIAIAKKYMDQFLGALGLPAPEEPPARPAALKPDPDAAAGIANALRSLDVPPSPAPTNRD